MTGHIPIPDRVDEQERLLLLDLQYALAYLNKALWQCGLYYDSGIPFEVTIETVGVRRERETAVISTPQVHIETPRTPESLESIVARIAQPIP